MIDEVEETEKYEIPKSDTVYRNKDSKKFTAVDLVNFHGSYLDRFLKGTRKIHYLDWVNICDGYVLSLKFLISERMREPGKEKEIEHKIKDVKLKILKVWDIFKGFDQPLNPNSMKLGEAEIEEWSNEIIMRDKYGNVESIKPQKLGTKLLNKFEFAYKPNFKEFLYYDESCGYFRPGAREFISQKAREILKEESTTYIVNEVVSYVRDLSLTNDEEFEPAPGLINMKNGVYDWKGRRLLAHSSKYHFRTMLPFGFNIHARRSPFFKFLEEITQDNPEKALTILEAIAWMFIPGYPIQKAIAFFGAGNNGKSVLLNFITAFIGAENISNTPLQTLCNNRFSVPGLRGKMANIAGDVSNATLSDTSIFKSLTGDDANVEGEIKGLQIRPRFKNTAKMIFAFNKLPKTWDQTRAYYRRFKLIEFLQDFSQKEDRNLIKKITREEDLQAVFNLIVEVFLPTLSANLEFYNEETTEETAQRYKLNSNPAMAFIDEMLEPNPDCEIEGKQLYNFFLNWCKENGISSVSQESFGRTLLKNSEMGVYHRSKQKDKERSYYYEGIKIKDSTDENEKNAQVLENKPKNLCTFVEALNYYVKVYSKNQNAYGSYVFCTLGRKSESIQKENIEKTYKPYAPKNFSTKKIQSSAEENKGAYVLTSQKGNLCTQEVSSSDINTSELSKSGINENKSDNKEAIPDLNQSYQLKKTILETAFEISNGNKGTWINPLDIFETVLHSTADIVISLEDLTEKILPTMSGEGLILISNGKIALTGKELKEPKSKEPDNMENSNEIRYILLSILEDINLAAVDGLNYNLRKGDIVNIPWINANLLIKRGWAREIIHHKSTENQKTDTRAQNDGTLGTHGTKFKPDPTKSDVQKEKSNHDENPETIEPITMKQADEIKNMLLRSGIHLKATDTGVSISGDRYNIGVPVSYYRQNPDMIDQTMSKWNFTKKNEGALGTVFFDIPLKKEVQP